ncbi:MAG TPA: caspase family protein [Candidatus Coprenecus stercoripullorum]|nr:caspase family protein [Candidatus Coprenecus stercoripullorum]
MRRLLFSLLILFSLAHAADARTPGWTESDYSSLYDSYRDNVSALKNSSRDSQDYMDAKQRLYEMRPYLQQGAVWYSRKGSQHNALLLAQAFVDIPMMEEFSGTSFPRDDYYPTMVYFAASGTYNSKDYRRAIPYLREYIATGASQNRKNVYMYLAKACSYVKDYRQAADVMEEASSIWPSDFNILSMTINACIDAEDNARLQKYVSRALSIKPSDPTLLNIQGRLHEDNRNFREAMEVYGKLRQIMPRSLEVAEHQAMNAYNLAVLYYNRGERRLAAEYFGKAIPIMENVVESSPSSVMFLQALATAYSCTGKHESLARTNRMLLAAGGMEVSGNDIPSMMAVNGTAVGNGGHPIDAGGRQLQSSGDGIPAYSSYARKYVEDRIGKWQEKDPYETLDEYKARVTEDARQAKVKELLKAAEDNYISIYAEDPDPSDIVLRPYDAENEVFLAETRYGEIIIPVPRADNEARMFESNWNGMQFRNPEYYIKDDRFALSSLTLVSPTGRIYRYDDSEALNYTETVVDMQFADIDYSRLATGSSSHGQPSQRISRKSVSVGLSDVDMNIPENPATNAKTFAVIIANENYQMVSPVPMAINDGRTLAKYCTMTLGIPESNVRYYEDATYGVFMRAMRDIKNVSDVYDGDINVIFYYAGHGIPDERTKDAYLLPVDSDGIETSACFPLGRVYADLGSLNAESVVVLMDACFSGGQRNGGMVLEDSGMRGVVVRTKQNAPSGSTVIFSAVSDEQTALPYTDKGHGLFTYFLLKKLQDTRGDVTLAELASYVTEKVEQQSVVVNRKAQTPTVTAAEAVADTWKSIKLRK